MVRFVWVLPVWLLIVCTWTCSSASRVYGNSSWSGPMFSGKSEELIRRLRRVQFAHQRIQADGRWLNAGGGNCLCWQLKETTGRSSPLPGAQRRVLRFTRSRGSAVCCGEFGGTDSDYFCFGSGKTDKSSHRIRT